MRRAVLLFALAGCDRVFLSESTDLDPDADPNSLCAGGSYTGNGGMFGICLDNTPGDVLSRDAEIRTGEPGSTTDECAQIVAQADADATELCIIAARRIEIDGTVRAIGRRPLVMLALDELVVTATGTIDVHGASGPQAAGSDFGDCTRGNGTTTTGGAGSGAAGGTFAALAGAGGRGSDGTMVVAEGGLAPPVLDLGIVRGGCPGSVGGAGASDTNRGTSGRSGGAVYLIAKRAITIAGTIDASGGGGGGGKLETTGVAGGGGGGGSGGLIGLDAPAVTFAPTAVVIANGGGGGGGGGDASNGSSGAGADPTAAFPFAAAGGIGGGLMLAGGHGGAGGDATTAAGAGAGGAAGGGGGGGSVGYVKIFAAQVDGQTAARLSPAPAP